MTWWQVLLLVLGVLLILAGILATLRARSLDLLHTNVAKSRAALERALVDRARATSTISRSGILDVASSVLLGELAAEAIEASVYPIVDDGLDDIRIVDEAGQVLPRHSKESPDRLLIESELSRALRHSVDELTDVEMTPELDSLQRARVSVQMTRRFHNNHVSQVRRVRKTPLVRALHLAGNAPIPMTVNLDDRSGRE